MFSNSFYAGHSIDYHWWVGGLLGVCFLTGNLLLLPRLGAALTVVMTVAGQIIMGVIIDTLGLLGANQTSLPFKRCGNYYFIIRILLMNHIPKINLKIKEISHFIFGCSLALFSDLRLHYKLQSIVDFQNKCILLYSLH